MTILPEERAALVARLRARADETVAEKEVFRHLLDCKSAMRAAATQIESDGRKLALAKKTIQRIAEWEQNPGANYGQLGELLVAYFHAGNEALAELARAPHEQFCKGGQMWLGEDGEMHEGPCTCRKQSDAILEGGDDE